MNNSHYYMAGSVSGQDESSPRRDWLPVRARYSYPLRIARCLFARRAKCNPRQKSNSFNFFDFPVVLRENIY